MNEKEMLKFAAKAGGIKLLDWRDNWSDETGGRGPAWRTADRALWNPLTDDGDALRLAVKLGINIYLDDDEECSTEWNSRQEWACVECGDDMDAAVRLAILRAAAEIGKAMP